jgi:hypothetical protein
LQHNGLISSLGQRIDLAVCFAADNNFRTLPPQLGPCFGSYPAFGPNFTKKEERFGFIAGFARTISQNFCTGGGGGATQVVKENFDLSTQIPVYLEKDAEQPVYQDDGAYPEWLWTLLEPSKTLTEQILDGTETLTPRERRAVVKKARRQLIKENNLASST